MRPMKRARKAFTNVSGEEIPPYAFVAVVDGSDTEKQHILDGDIPDGGSDTIYLASGPKAIANSAIGHGYWTDDICVVAYNPGGGTPVAGQEWGPVANSWYLDSTGTGFAVLSVTSSMGLARVSRLSGSGGVQVIRFELTAEVVANSQFTALVKSRPPGRRQVSEETEYGAVTVHDMIGCLLDEDEADLIGRQGYATYLETRDEYDSPTKRWEITSLCCPP